MSHIFISYNQEDADFAAVLMMTLEKAGFDTWMDKSRLRAGTDWSEEIDRGILTALAVVLVISPDSRQSEYVTYEWSCALGAGVHVVPLLRRDTEAHPRLRRLQYLDFRGNVRPWDELVRLLNSIKAEREVRWNPPRDAPSHLQRAIVDLDSGNSADRKGAIAVLCESDHEVARMALRHALSHALRDVRALAAIGLAEKKDPTITTTELGLSALKDALGYRSEDEKDRTSWLAESAFLKVGRPAYEFLARVSKLTTDPARYHVVRLLSQVGNREAIPVLLELMDDLEEEIVVSAIKQLGDLKAAEAAPRIMLELERAKPEEEKEQRYIYIGSDQNDRCIAAVAALINIGDTSIEPRLVAATKQHVPVARMAAAQVLGELVGPKAIPVIGNLLTDTEEASYMYYEGGIGSGGRLTVGQVAARALDKIHTPDALNLIREYRREHPAKESSWKWLSID